tara:strand:- start:992 stop:2557 length:1566 start_codon:yes stop_codon:yes gene_type:complete
MAEIVLEEAREIGTAIAAPIKSMLPVPAGAGGIQPIEGEVIPAGSRMPATQKDSPLVKMFKEFLKMIKKMIDGSKKQTQAIEQNTDELKEVAKPTKERDPTKALGKQEVDRLRTERKTELGFIADAQAELDEMSPEEALKSDRGQSLKRQIDGRKENVEKLETTIRDAGFAVEELKEGVADFKTPLGDVYNAMGQIALLPDRLFGDTLKAFDKMTGNAFGLNEAYENMKKSVKGLIKEGFEKLKIKAMDFAKKGFEPLKKGFEKLKIKAMDFGKKAIEPLKKGFGKFTKTTLPKLGKSFGGIMKQGAMLAKSFLGIIAMNLLAIATNPYVLLALAITGAIAAIAMFAPKLFEHIKGIGQAILDGIDSVITTLLNGVISLLNMIPGVNIDKLKTEKEKRAEKEDPLHHMKKAGMLSDGEAGSEKDIEAAKARQAILGGSVADEGSRFVRGRVNEEMQTERKKEMLADLTTQRAADAGLTPPINIVKGGNIVQNAQSNVSMNKNINDPESLEMAYRMREFGVS